MVRIAQILPLGIEQQLVADAGIEEVSRHAFPPLSRPIWGANGLAATHPPDAPRSRRLLYCNANALALAQIAAFALLANRTERHRLRLMAIAPLEMEMAWKAPKIVEVPVGMEINMYACAARK